MKVRDQDIAEKLKTHFDFKDFESLITIEGLLDQLKGENINDEAYLITERTTSAILAQLNNLKNVLDLINNDGQSNNYIAKWMLTGRIDLFKIFSSIDLLEYNIDMLLTEIEQLPSAKTTTILDNLTNICNLNISIKKSTYPLKIRLGILNHYNEIQNEVLASVYGELIYYMDQLEQLDIKKQLLNVEKELSKYTLDAFLQKKNENEIINSGIKSNGFIILSTLDSQIFSQYTELHNALLPIAESLKLIPLTLEDFYSTSKTYYPALVGDCITKYEEITKLYSTYIKTLRDFKTNYIHERNDMVCEIIFNDIDIYSNPPPETMENIISIVKPIDLNYGLSGKYLQLLKDIEYKLNCVTLEENIFKTPLPKAKSTPKFRRSFSNPLADSLNIKSVLSEPIRKSNSDIKIFQTPKLTEEAVFSKENSDLIERIKLDLKSEMMENIPVPNTPLFDSSFSSTSSSPDTMRVKNIFDSPDPFVTPNSRSLYKSKLPILTPSTTPRITPTKKYVMLPIDEEPKNVYDWNHSNSSIQTPLLRYELSTVIKTEIIESESDTSIDSIESIESPEACRSVIVATGGSPGDVSPVGISKIPLPTRPESRMNLMRSASRMDVEKGRQTPMVPRPDSRLANMASSISSRLGTRSPTVSGPTSKLCTDSIMRARSTSVMSQREMQPRVMPIQLGRLQPRSVGLHIRKARGPTALGTRSELPQSRITSV